jgi:aerobic carbon-monoxide dehydrogenase small subunit
MNSITINGKEYTISEDQLEMSLLNFLRENLIMTGTKNGCEKGVCGSCTVTADNRAVRSCRMSMEKMAGKQVITIEGMEYPDGTLHPIQQGFIDAGAIQCGFCTPGMVMSAYALLLANPEPSREEIRKAMRGNLCRCTGYQQIVDAVELAARRIKEEHLSVTAGCLT